MTPSIPSSVAAVTDSSVEADPFIHHLAPSLPDLFPPKPKVKSTGFQNISSQPTKANMEKPTKSYAQALRQSPSISDVLKIKGSFLTLNASQIDRVNNIVKGNPKPKLCIQMTMKGPSRKQIIVPMSGDNSAAHISNLNRLLGNAKTEVMVDFIRPDPIGLVIATNKVVVQSDLQIINQYVKKSDDINELQVKEPRLS